MKVVRVLFFMICMISFVGCAHKVVPIQQQSILDDSSVDQRYKDAVRQGRVIPGMTHNMVEATLGPADLVNYSSFDDGSQAEVWVYKPSLVKEVISARYGISTQYLYVAFREGKTITIFNAVHVPSVITVPRSNFLDR